MVDPKKADFAAYARATIVTPNLLEAERAAGASAAGDEAVARAADEMRVALELDAMLITRGPEGMTLSAPEGITHIPAQIRDVADVTGAGDTVVAVLAACLGSGWDLAESCRLANVAAGIAVSHPGTYVVHADELAMAWKGLSHKVLNRESARRRVADARRRGRKVVFTNGCFDILHAGHLASLEGANRLRRPPGRRPQLRRLGPRPQGGLPSRDRPGEPRQPAGRAGLRRRRRHLRRAHPRGADPELDPTSWSRAATTRSTRSPAPIS